MSSYTKTDIFNLALDIVRDAALTDTGAQTASARWLNRNFDLTVEAALQAYPWNCAKEKAILPEDATPPAFGFAHRYRKPPGCLRVLPITENGFRDGRPVPHEVVGDFIETDAGGPLKVRWIKDISATPNLFSPLLIEVVRCRLAVGMALKFTGKAAWLQVAQNLLSAAQGQAETIDAFEGSAEPVEQHDIIRARYGTGVPWGYRE